MLRTRTTPRTYTATLRPTNNTTRISTANKSLKTSLFGNQTQLRTAYGGRILDHYENPRNVGSLEKKDSSVGTGVVGAPACGDVMKLQIQVDPETGKVSRSVFKTFGCGSAIASSSVATEWLKGKSLDEALDIKNTDIAQHLSLPPVKLHCSMLAEDAIRSAVSDLKKKLDSDKAEQPQQEQQQ
eukprot:gb/GECH01011331.1/.p1 GENE.gb/GECH01011331.1/~~gb/GECH01011331.1/.p1  ORF type:complete len:184 (+),score=41.39 gb/GECH01011331.1/:1-552(+)